MSDLGDLKRAHGLAHKIQNLKRILTWRKRRAAGRKTSAPEDGRRLVLEAPAMARDLARVPAIFRRMPGHVEVLAAAGRVCDKEPGWIENGRN